MKKPVKFCLSIAGTLLAVGIVCVAAGAVMGGRGETDRYFKENWQTTRWAAALEHVETFFDHTELPGLHGEELLEHIPGHGESDHHDSNSGGTYPVSLDGVTAIEVDVDCADIQVREGESASIDLSWNLSNYAMNYEVEEGCLKVNSESWGHGKLPDNFHIDCKVILTLPVGTELERLELSTDMGDVDVDAALTVKEADLSTNLGDVTTRSLRANDLDADTDLGDVRLQLPGERGDYCWDLETSLGELVLDGEKQSSGLGEISHQGGAGKSRVEASSSLGNVRLSFD